MVLKRLVKAGLWESETWKRWGNTPSSSLEEPGSRQTNGYSLWGRWGTGHGSILQVNQLKIIEFRDQFKASVIIVSYCHTASFQDLLFSHMQALHKGLQSWTQLLGLQMLSSFHHAIQSQGEWWSRVSEQPFKEVDHKTHVHRDSADYKGWGHLWGSSNQVTHTWSKFQLLVYLSVIHLFLVKNFKIQIILLAQPILLPSRSLVQFPEIWCNGLHLT